MWDTNARDGSFGGVGSSSADSRSVSKSSSWLVRGAAAVAPVVRIFVLNFAFGFALTFVFGRFFKD